MKLKYTREAIKDLIRVRDFISKNNPEAAFQIASELVEGITALTTFPEMGVKVIAAPEPEMVRDIYILDYQIRYLLLEKSIYILRIWHQKENRPLK